MLLAIANLILLASGASAKSDPAVPAMEVLERHCVSCHGGQKISGKLRLGTREELMRGGASGQVVTLDKPDESLLLRAVSYTDPDIEMPPSEKLSAADVEILRRWLRAGAPWPSGRRLGTGLWWAFQPPKRTTPPSGDGHPIDAFLDAARAHAGIPTATAAERAILCRRATMDLHGVPATAEEVDTFVKDSRPDAFAQLVDRLLASRRYGEKWGRHFLDTVRYSDSTGFEQDPFHLEAWRFRDYIIKSFNADKPYDRLAQEMLAGDELWPDDPTARAATAFMSIGPNRDYLNRNEEPNRIEKLTDYVETTSSVFLGLTLGCARCHDHKFDPLLTKDFYRLQAVFEPAVYSNVVLDYEAGKAWDRENNAREFRLRQLASRFSELQRKRKEPGHKKSASETAELGRLEKAIAALFVNYWMPPVAIGMTDAGPTAAPSFVALRGNPKIRGEQIQPGFPGVLGGKDIVSPAGFASTTGRRRAFAEWLTQPNHPLFARVMVNRIWQLHFGRGLVATANDFGLRAGRPSHPELLDWLATEFVAQGYSMKAMHRMIMLTAAYQRSADVLPGAMEKDPENIYLGRFSRRRLLAEEIRDSVLLVSGNLNPTMGGMPVVPPLAPNELFGIQGDPGKSWPVTPNPEEHLRRSVYLLNLRTFRTPLFDAFDAPDGLSSCSRRHESTTAPQSLAMLNSDFMVKQAAELARRHKSIDGIFRAVLARNPTDIERSESQTVALPELARVLINTNEFLYVE